MIAKGTSLCELRTLVDNSKPFIEGISELMAFTILVSVCSDFLWYYIIYLIENKQLDRKALINISLLSNILVGALSSLVEQLYFYS